MFGNNGEVIRNLTVEKFQLEQEVERLQRLQPGGLALEYATHFDGYVHDRVSSDYDPMNPDTGIPVSGMDVVFENALRAAAQQTAPQALAELKPERLLAFTKEVLSDEVLGEIAVSALTKLLQESPDKISEILDADHITTVINKLTDDEKAREFILDKLMPKIITEQTVDDLKEEIKKFGYFSTDKLPLGKPVIAGLREDNESYINISGTVVSASDGVHWISVKEFRGHGYYSKRSIEDHTLIRFGHIDGEGKLVYKLSPNTKGGIFYFDSPEDIEYNELDVVYFNIDADVLFNY